MDFYQTMETLNLIDEPVWTISDKHKIPMNAKRAVAAHFDRESWHQWFAHATDTDDLVSLRTLKSESKTPMYALTLALDLEKQGIMVIDIEQHFDPAALWYLQCLPVLYGERSKHGGLHYLVRVPQSIRQDPKYATIFAKSRLKFAATNAQHSGVEVFFRQHYLMFTQNLVEVRQNNTDEDLRTFFNCLLTQANTNQVQHHDYLAPVKHQTASKISASPDAQFILKHGLSTYNRKSIKYIINNNHESDLSTREYQIIFAIARFLVKNCVHSFAPSPFNAYELQDDTSKTDPVILAWVLLQYTYEFLNYRPKWDRPATHGQTYIQYTVNNALSYALEHVKP